ncbi:MAG: hypothetical protein HY092_03795 [Candidatus Kerfeldbacteria bacterium]|nr:hypothetical protein [Candidatus Kerfeldbacteria bacterium]
MSTLNPIQRACLRTIAYYDIFDYPLTQDEIVRWCYPEEAAEVQAEDVDQAIAALLAMKKIEQKGAWYFLPGRSAIVATRALRTVSNAPKWRRAETAARWIEMVPHVKFVGVVNTLATDNARPESDIDFFIITSPEHLWSARAMVTGLVSLLGYRRHGKKITNRICLSFYVTERAMDFSTLRLSDDDHYLHFWLTQIVPLLDEQTFEKFRAANAWIKDKIPHGWSDDWRERLIPSDPGRRAIRRFFELFFATPVGGMVELQLRQQQLNKMEKNEASKAKLGTTEVVINDDMLKFHEADRRAQYNELFEERLEALGL